MRFKILFIMLILKSHLSFAADIPLDSYGETSWVLSTSGDGKVLNGYLGRSPQWRVREDSSFAVKSNTTPLKDRLWKDYYLLTEDMPFNAVADPTQRVWNLSDLIDRLKLEGRLPSSLRVVSSDDRGMTIVVTKPTIISASVATFRHVTIINRSKLTLLCPLCRNVSIINDNKDSYLEIYSYMCIDAAGAGTLKRYNLGEWLYPCRDNSNILDSNGLMSAIELFPQVLVSQTLGRTPSELFKLWNELYKITL